MALHPDITRKPDNEFVLDLANTAIALASRQQTGNAGSVTIPDGGVTEDGAPAGTGLVAGEQAASVGGVGKRLADGTLIPLADGNDVQELQTSVEADIKTVSDKADDIRTEADNTAAGLDAANTQISQTQDQVTGLTTSVSNAQQDATSALTQISTTQQDLSGFKQSVAQDYDTKSDALDRESTIQQSLTEFEQSVSQTYVDKTTAATYATKTDVSQTASDITSQVSASYATKDDLSDVSDDVSAAQDDATSALYGVEKLNSDIPNTYATQSLLSQVASGIQSDVKATYATKDSVTDLSTTVSQTATDLTTRIQNAQDGVDGLQTVVRVDADGVHVGKQADGTTSGYSVLVNANGSVDILASDGSLVGRFDSNGLSILDTGNNTMRSINRSVFNSDPLFATAKAEDHPADVATSMALHWNDYNNACIRIQFTTNWNTAVRVDLGAYIACNATNHGSANGTCSIVMYYGFQIWRKNADGTNTLFLDLDPHRAAKNTTSVWNDNSSISTGNSASASYVVTGLEQYTTYYLETRTGNQRSVPANNAGYSTNYDLDSQWACVTPLS